MSNILLHSVARRSQGHQVLLEITAEAAGWDLIDFRVRRITAGSQWRDNTGENEACLVLLSGECRIRWEGGREQNLGPRRSVFSSYPHAAYLPPGTRFQLTATQTTELADGRAPSGKGGQPRLIRPEQCGFEIRGGGNATRQIVDVVPPEFPAHRLLVCEVFTPAGNWSSFPPHKHDVDNYPEEVRLEEIYYYRYAEPEAFGYQRVYRADGSRDETVMVTDGDLVLIRDGYHPFVTSYGYDAYYLNFLAGKGEDRSMAASDDPSYARFRDNWPPPDPRLPLLPKPESAGLKAEVQSAK